MTKLNKHFIIYLILISYLGVFFANVYHYHNYFFSLNRQERISEERKIGSSQHSIENCFITSTFNSIHNIYFNFICLNLNYFNASDFIINHSVDRLKSLYFLSQKLRAPPSYHS